MSNDLESLERVFRKEQKNAIALNEMNSNEESTDGERLIHIELSRTRIPRMCACIWNSG